MASTDQVRLNICFENNRFLTDLYGGHGENLALLEKKLGLEITSRGNEVVISGAPQSSSAAKQVLEALYMRLEAGQAIERGDFLSTLAFLDIGAKDASGDPGPGTLEDAHGFQIGTRRKRLLPRTPKQKRYIETLNQNELTLAIGPAGTGKTLLAVAHAAARLEHGEVGRVILTRPAVEAGERLGFLPGDMREKVDPYLRPLFDGLNMMMKKEKIERCLEDGRIEIAPLAFMRGRTLAHAVVILDEAQNTTAMQMKMFLTRLGENAQMIITGDPTQIDLPVGQKSGLIDAIDIFSRVPEIAVCHFDEEDVVRHALVKKIVSAYNARDKQAKTPHS